MATKNKKIETRLDKETYDLLKEAADNFERSMYAMVALFIYRGLDELNRPKNVPPEHRCVSLLVSDEVYKKLDKMADEYGGTIPDVVWSCVLDTLKRLEKHK